MQIETVLWSGYASTGIYTILVSLLAPTGHPINILGVLSLGLLSLAVLGVHYAD